MKFLKSLVLPAVFSVLCFVVSDAIAQPTINLGAIDLNPNEANQEILIEVTGGDPVAGINFFLEVGGGTSGPAITSVDLVNGTIFDGNTLGQSNNGPVNTRQAAEGTLTLSGTVTADNTLARVVFDTTGITTGSFGLELDTTIGTTTFLDSGGGAIATSLTSGTINIVPEPASMAVLGIGSLALLTRRRTARDRSRLQKLSA